jgi:sugar phosphate isomerase/epimerase
MSIFLSSGAFKTRDFSAVRTLALAEGLTTIELSSGMTFESGLIDAVRRASGAPFRFLVHNYFPPPAFPFVLNLASNDPDTLTLSRRHCMAAIDLSAQLGAPFYSVHSGFAYSLRPEMLGDAERQRTLGAYDYNEAYDIFIESLSTLCEYARARGLRLLIENNVVSPRIACDRDRPPFLMARHEEIERLFSDVADATLGLLIDVAHAKVSATALGFDPVAFVERLAVHTVAFHLSDNDGQADTNSPFQSDAWFSGIVSELRDRIMVIEVYRLEPDAMRQQVEVLTTMLATGVTSVSSMEH